MMENDEFFIGGNYNYLEIGRRSPKEAAEAYKTRLQEQGHWKQELPAAPSRELAARRWPVARRRRRPAP